MFRRDHCYVQSLLATIQFQLYIYTPLAQELLGIAELQPIGPRLLRRGVRQRAIRRILDIRHVS